MSIDNNDWDDDMEDSDFDDIFDSNIDEKTLEKYEKIRAGEKCTLSEEEFENLMDYHQLDDDKVLEILEFAIENYPYSKDFSFEKLVILRNLEKSFESVEFVKTCLEKFNDDFRFFYFYAEYFQGINDNFNSIKYFKEAIELAQKYNQNNTDDDDFFLFEDYSYNSLIIQYSTFMMSIDKENEVNELLNEVLIKNHTSNHIYSFFYINIFSKGINPKGLKYLENLINIAPYNYLAWFTKGKIEQIDEQNEKAIESVEYAHLINPKFIDASFFLGSVYEEQKKYDKAIEYYKITVDNENALEIVNEHTLLCISRCYFEINRYDLVRHYLNKTEYFNDFNPEHSYLFGMSFMMENEFRKALPFIKKAYQLNKNEIEYIIPLINLYCNLNEIEKIKKLITELRKNEGFPFLEYWYEIASIFFNTNQHDYLEEFLEEILHNYPESKIQVSAFLTVITYSLKPNKTSKKELVRKYHLYPILVHELCGFILKENYENDLEFQLLKEIHNLN